MPAYLFASQRRSASASRSLLAARDRAHCSSSDRTARRFKQVHHMATTALHRRAGWRLCEHWLAEIGKAAGT